MWCSNSPPCYSGRISGFYKMDLWRYSIGESGAQPNLLTYFDAETNFSVLFTLYSVEIFLSASN